MTVVKSARAVRHSHASRAPRPVRCAVVTVSDTRSKRNDPSGDVITRMLERANHQVLVRNWVSDRIAAIRRAVRAALLRKVDVVILTGGTGLAPRDRTPEALEPLIEVALPGFGERFRALSTDEVGSATWLSRAGAGVAKGRLLVWLPGSTAAVTLALEQLLIPELGHAVRLLGRFANDEKGV
jgi:molybdenum cofactor biosynthesis protein B